MVVAVVTRRRAILVKATLGRQGTFLKHWNAIGIMPGMEQLRKGRRCCIGGTSKDKVLLLYFSGKGEIQPTNNNATSLLHSLWIGGI